MKSRHLRQAGISRREVVGYLAALTTIPALHSCSKRPGLPTELLRGNGPELDTLDPQRAATSEAHNVLRDLFECLTRLDQRGDAIPAAAASWAIADDGLSYDLRLRPGLRWSNGEPVEAKHFVAGFRRLVNPTTAAPYAELIEMVQGASDIVAGKLGPESLGVTSIAPDHLRLSLVRPCPYLPAVLANVATAPSHHAQYNLEAIDPMNRLTNGAFKIQEVVVGSHVRLTRNKSYWNDAETRVDTVKFLHTADENAELRAYRANELHITAAVPRGQFDWITTKLPGQLRIGPQLNTYYYGFNLDRPVFKNAPGLRRALSLVIDRDLLAKGVLRVGELPAYGWIPPGIHSYAPQRFDYAKTSHAERVEEAQQLYKEAGYSSARPLRFSLSYNAGEVHNKVAIAVASMWKEHLGADVTIEAVEFRSLLERINRREIDMFRLSWRGDYLDPYTFLQCLRSDSAANTVHFRDTEFDQLLNAALNAPDHATRTRLYESGEQRILSMHALIPIYFYVNKHLVKPNVHGWYSHPLDVVYSRDLSLTSV